MSTFSVALVQFDGHGTDTSANLRQGLAACRRAAGLGVDLVLFPEWWQIGYTDCPADAAGRHAWADCALDPADPWLQAFRETARRAPDRCCDHLPVAVARRAAQRGDGHRPARP
jgi:predicted amidohydrolase